MDPSPQDPEPKEPAQNPEETQENDNNEEDDEDAATMRATMGFAIFSSTSSKSKHTTAALTDPTSTSNSASASKRRKVDAVVDIDMSALNPASTSLAGSVQTASGSGAGSEQHALRGLQRPQVETEKETQTEMERVGAAFFKQSFIEDPWRHLYAAREAAHA